MLATQHLICLSHIMPAALRCQPQESKYFLSPVPYNDLMGHLPSESIPKVHETEAQDRKCLKEYGGDVGFSFCAPRIYPLFCYRRCRQNKGGAKGGKCRSEAGTGMKCLCDFCSNTP
ncbi:hypothetical protein F2Q69_00002207 [Brassica cretica]|uniref:Knottins-like domain-containing protein n=1 Tax=Brassica cretica TaxID=69181 RepID=A0A8S9PIN2_BRACR|nr:hypothetical protein F2Q69_00002207 [Brassica cretica]